MTPADFDRICPPSRWDQIIGFYCYPAMEIGTRPRLIEPGSLRLDRHGERLVLRYKSAVAADDSGVSMDHIERVLFANPPMPKQDASVLAERLVWGERAQDQDSIMNANKVAVPA